MVLTRLAPFNIWHDPPCPTPFKFWPAPPRSGPLNTSNKMGSKSCYPNVKEGRRRKTLWLKGLSPQSKSLTVDLMILSFCRTTVKLQNYILIICIIVLFNLCTTMSHIETTLIQYLVKNEKTGQFLFQPVSWETVFLRDISQPNPLKFNAYSYFIFFL